MSKKRLAYCVLSILLAPATAVDAQSFFTARLTGASEPNGASGSGSGTAAFVLEDGDLRFMVSFDSLTGPVSAAHFHMAPAGENGGVVRTITDDLDGNSGGGVWTTSDPEPLTPNRLAALWRGELYLNFHTAANPGGELRGQIYPSSGTGLTASLTVDQETHEVSGEGSGTASILLSDDVVLYAITVSGLSGDLTAAHFHSGRSGVAGGVVKTVTGDFDGPTAIGMWTPSDDEPLTDELVTDLLLGNLYLNVHTADHPPGEIRGQVVVNSGLGMRAMLNSEQSGEGVASDGLGTATVTVNTAGVSYDVTVSGLTGPISAAHFHNAPAGENGGVVRTIEFENGRAAGLWTDADSEPLTSELLQELLAGNLYINIHTAAHPGGEIRGQVLAHYETALSAGLDPFQESAEVSSAGTGTAAMMLTDAGLEFSLTVDSLTGPIQAAHFHSGPMGSNGGVVRTITDDFTGNTATGVWTSSDPEPLSEELLVALLTGNLYLNVHTAAFPAGEVRGQVLVSGGTSLTSGLDAAQEVADVTSSGSGTGSLTATSQGVIWNVTVDSLSGDFSAAHFHAGPIGANGGVVKTITEGFVGHTSSGVWRASDSEALTSELITELVTGGLYFNVHTPDNPGGEVRGQIRMNSGAGSAIQLDTDQQEQEVMSSSARGTASVTQNPEGVVFDLTYEGLNGPLTAAHFHNAPSGQNGGVVRTITGDFEGPTASGFWTMDDDEPLTAELFAAILRGETYLNLHTATNPAGEIRGQILPGDAVVTSVEEISTEIPDRIELRQNYPNPFNPETQIAFTLDRTIHSRLSVYNSLGQVVAVLLNRPMSAGTYRVSFDAAGLPSGVYFAQLRAGEHSRGITMILMK